MENKDSIGKVFEKLSGLNVNGHTETREVKNHRTGGTTSLTYLSWAWAWETIMQLYPEATYEVVKDPAGLPYFASPLGIMVYTRVTIKGQTREMWLPVMDGTNRALTPNDRKLVTKYGETTIPAATMTDINKAIMRCLTKNLAMFGLGLYIYRGEDLPAVTKEQCIDMVADCDENGLSDIAADYADLAADKEVKAAMFARLQSLIQAATSIDETRRIYAASKWTQKDPRLLQWCEARNKEFAAKKEE